MNDNNVTSHVLVHHVLVLFAMVNVVGNLPLFAQMTRELTPPEKKHAFRVAVLTACSIVVTFAFFGNWMLQSFFEVETGAFKVAGGILVFAVAAQGIILGPQRSSLISVGVSSDIGVFPMGFPFLAGPGTIVTTILLMQQSGSAITALAAIVVYAAVVPILYLTPLIQRAGGRVGSLVVSRILYIFIASKAVTFIISGIKACLGAA